MTRYRDEDDDGDEPCPLGQGQVIKETEKAILFEPEDGDKFWVPKSVIHENSEAWSAKNPTGTLVVKRWWAAKEGRA